MSYLLRVLACATSTTLLVAGLASPDAVASAVVHSLTLHSDGTWTAPADVSSVSATVVGGNGGTVPGPAGCPVPRGAKLDVNLSISPGSTLHIRVGGNGQAPSGDQGGAGGANGGGAGGAGTVGSGRGGAAGGGGASDIRLNSPDLSARVIVAGGGGGDGYLDDPTNNCAASGGIGDYPSGYAGYYGWEGGISGGGGSSTAGGWAGLGRGATHVSNGSAGAATTGGTGGDGPYAGGGGGGGFYGGGGAGGCDPTDATNCEFKFAGGGGGGSSFVDEDFDLPSYGQNEPDATGGYVIINWVGGDAPASAPSPTPAPTPSRVVPTIQNGCVVVPRSMPRRGTITVEKPNCLTTTGQQVRLAVTVAGPRANRQFVAVKCRAGRRLAVPNTATLGAWCRSGNLVIRTSSPRNLKLTLAWRSAATSRSFSYSYLRSYRTA